jgi:hypothetical protein
MNRFRVISVNRVPGRDDSLVVLETLEGSIEAVPGELFDEEDGEAWRLTSIALHEPQNPSEKISRRLVGLEGDNLPKVGSVLLSWC